MLRSGVRLPRRLVSQVRVLIEDLPIGAAWLVAWADLVGDGRTRSGGPWLATAVIGIGDPAESGVAQAQHAVTT